MPLACDALCDAPSSRVLDQTMVRYNDRSAFANNASQDIFNNMNMQFLATAQNQLEQNGLANLILQLRAVGTTPTPTT